MSSTTDELISNAAIGTLYIPSQLVESDPLLCIVSSLLNPQQLVVKSSSSKDELSLSLRQDTLVLRQRNAILRALCGGELLGILDRGPSWYLLGGGGAGVTTMAGVTSWMSVASSVREGSDYSDVSKLLSQLNDSVLARQSFLVPQCGAATLADVDLYLALRERMDQSKDDNDGDDKKMSWWKDCANVRRWWNSVQSTVAAMIRMAPQQQQQQHTKYLEPTKAATTNAGPPVFYYGDEKELAPTPKPTDKSNSKNNSNNTQQTKNNTETIKEKKPNDNTTTTPTKPTSSSSELTDEQKKAAAEKRAKKKAAKAKKQPTPSTTSAATATTELNVSALDIRVGKIVRVWEHETADKLFCEEVDMGEATGPRRIASGLRPFYQAADLQDQSVLVLANLKARNLVGFPSHGMVLCASNAAHDQVELVHAPPGAALGERVLFEGLEGGEPETENKMNKKKLFEKLAPDLQTDEHGGVVWKGKKAMAGGGQCRAINGMANGAVA